MTHTPSVDWFAISPSLAILAAAGLCLLSAVLVRRTWIQPVAAFFCACGFAAGIAAAGLLYWKSGDRSLEVADAISRDRLGAFAQILIAACGVLAVGISYSSRRRYEHVGEYYALLATAGAGMAFFVTANSLLTLFLGLEWFSICLYVLCAMDLDEVRSLEAGLKYLIVGSFGSGVLLFGATLVYGATGALGFQEIGRFGNAHDSDALLLVGLAMMLAGLAFKASAAPFHQWTPDVYEGAPSPVTAFMSAATKAAALVVTLRILNDAFPAFEDVWTIALAAIVCISLAVGNLAALVQRRVKRLLAYSSISHAGFLLIGIAAG